eukprot:tig00020927_g15983.t1
MARRALRCAGTLLLALVLLAGQSEAESGPPGEDHELDPTVWAERFPGVASPRGTPYVKMGRICSSRELARMRRGYSGEISAVLADLTARVAPEAVSLAQLAAMVHDIASDHDDILGVDVQPGDVIIDVGAHVGLFSMVAARLWPHARVYAVEMAPAPFALLQHNIRANNLSSSVTPFLAALVPTATTAGESQSVRIVYDPESSLHTSLYSGEHNPELALEEEEAAAGAEEVPALSLPALYEAIRRDLGLGRADGPLPVDCEGCEHAALADEGALDGPAARLLSLRGEAHSVVSEGVLSRRALLRPGRLAAAGQLGACTDRALRAALVYRTSERIVCDAEAAARAAARGGLAGRRLRRAALQASTTSESAPYKGAGNSGAAPVLYDPTSLSSPLYWQYSSYISYFYNPANRSHESWLAPRPFFRGPKCPTEFPYAFDPVQAAPVYTGPTAAICYFIYDSNVAAQCGIVSTPIAFPPYEPPVATPAPGALPEPSHLLIVPSRVPVW